LKLPCSNLIVIGAAVPSSLKSGRTGNFGKSLHMSDLVLKKGDSDFEALVETLVKSKHPVESSQMCTNIAYFILEYCGGHVFPTLALLAEVFTELPSELLLTLVTFQEYLFSQSFENSRVYSIIINRCFDHVVDTEVAADHILSGIDQVGDLNVISRWGWWNSETEDFISTLLKHYCQSFICKSSSPKPMSLISDADNNNFSNTIKVVLDGLYNMKVDDFKCMGNLATKTPIENALSFSWSKRALLQFSNLYMKSQITSPHSGYADFYINGHCSCIIEFIRNATRSTCDEHLNRFLTGKYPWKRFIIFNFDMHSKVSSTESVVIALPTNGDYHHIVFTYVHSTNTLYCGNIAIRSPAVSCLESSAVINNPLPIDNFI
jgi:hypothetical protein